LAERTLNNNQTEPNLAQTGDYVSITQAQNPEGAIAPTIDTIAIQATNQQKKQAAGKLGTQHEQQQSVVLLPYGTTEAE